jgi:hypothetical protein
VTFAVTVMPFAGGANAIGVVCAAAVEAANTDRTTARFRLKAEATTRFRLKAEATIATVIMVTL